MQLNAHLSFNGQCEEAFKFYERTLAARIQMLVPWGGSPIEGHVPPDFKTKVAHATLTVGDHQITGADVPPEQYRKPEGFSILLSLQDIAESERIYAALSENETARAARFGMLIDQFGIPWMINCEKAG